MALKLTYYGTHALSYHDCEVVVGTKPEAQEDSSLMDDYWYDPFIYCGKPAKLQVNDNGLMWVCDKHYDNYPQEYRL